MGTTPAGGPATVGGVVYQMLWCLLRLTRFEIRQIDRAESASPGSALLVLEPKGGGGDAQEIEPHRYVVTQLKSRSGGGSWSLQEVITGVLPDLLKAVDMTASDPTYQFVTDGHIGEWVAVQRFFSSLKSRKHRGDPLAQLDTTNPMKVGARAGTGATTKPFWEKSAYTERDLFEKIAQTLDPHVSGEARRQLELRTWHLLGHFVFADPLPRETAEAEIDASLVEIIEFSETVEVCRQSLLMKLAEFARAGNAAIRLGSFLKDAGYPSIRKSDARALLNASARVNALRVASCGYEPAHHVQTDFTESLVSTVKDNALVVVAGDSGSGKSWHTCALAVALANRDALVVHADADGTARSTLDTALAVLWNAVKEQTGTRPYDRVAKGLPGPPPMRVIIIDRVENPTVARDLALAPLDSLGLRLVLACGKASTDAIRAAVRSAVPVIEVGRFSGAELADYLVARRVPHADAVPADVRELLVQPMLARIYSEIASGGWVPTTEYELFRAYWMERLEHNPAVNATLDLALLRDLARATIAGEKYPWRSDFVNATVRHEHSLGRLLGSGWLCRQSGGECLLWHDRLLNWVVADALVEDLLRGSRSASDLAKLCVQAAAGELRADHRWLGYVPMDVLWLLAERAAPASASSEILSAMEQSSFCPTLYTDTVPTLGKRAIGGLLHRLAAILAGDRSYRAIQIATCLASLDSPEAVATARELLRSDSVERRSVALHILRRQGDVASLDRIWALHVGGVGDPNWVVEYDRRMDALAAGIRLRPAWLIEKLTQAEPSTACLPDLVYLFARLTDRPDDWKRLKGHLKHIVPEDKRRCLVRCIMAFRDQSEVEYLRSQVATDADMAGDMALAALTRLDPDAAIDDIARSELRYLGFTRAWHLHPLLAARPESTRGAIGRLSSNKPSLPRELYSDAENEIDVDSFDRILDDFDAALQRALAPEEASESDGQVFGFLNFLEHIHRPDLLERLRARKGTTLDDNLAQYLLACGPRSDVAARLNDRQSFALLEWMGSDAVPQLVAIGLKAPSWYGQIDAAGHAHKHPETVVLQGLRDACHDDRTDENQKFVAYVCVHALAILEDWEHLIPIVMESGLAISPYLFEQRRTKGPLEEGILSLVRDRFRQGDVSSGVLLAAGLTRASEFVQPIANKLQSGELDRDQFLSAAIALDVLQVTDPQIVRFLLSKLNDETLRERLLGLLLSIGTPEALDGVAAAMDAKFDCDTCSALGHHDQFREVAAGIAWRHRITAERSLSYSRLIPILGSLSSPDVKAYLESLAFGHGRTLFGRSLRIAGIRGLSHRFPELAFRTAESVLRNPLSDERRDAVWQLKRLDAQQAVPLLLEIVRTVRDEAIEFTIASALSGDDLELHLVPMLQSDRPDVVRVACILSSYQRPSDQVRLLLQSNALHPDEQTRSMAIHALRERVRTASVSVLVEKAIAAQNPSERGLYLDWAATHGRGDKKRPGVPGWVTAPLRGRVSELEGKRFDDTMRKGDEEFASGIRDRARRKAERSPPE